MSKLLHLNDKGDKTANNNIAYQQKRYIGKLNIPRKRKPKPMIQGIGWCPIQGRACIRGINNKRIS